MAAILRPTQGRFEAVAKAAIKVAVKASATTSAETVPQKFFTEISTVCISQIRPEPILSAPTGASLNPARPRLDHNASPDNTIQTMQLQLPKFAHLQIFSEPKLLNFQQNIFLPIRPRAEL